MYGIHNPGYEVLNLEQEAQLSHETLHILLHKVQNHPLKDVFPSNVSLCFDMFSQNLLDDEVECLRYCVKTSR
jgi:hypothetical protein